MVQIWFASARRYSAREYIADAFLHEKEERTVREMGLLDEIKKLARPYDDEEDTYYTPSSLERTPVVTRNTKSDSEMDRKNKVVNINHHKKTDVPEQWTRVEMCRLVPIYEIGTSHLPSQNCILSKWCGLTFNVTYFSIILAPDGNPLRYLRSPDT